MTLTPTQIAYSAVGAAVYLGAVYFIDRSITGRVKAVFRWLVAATVVGAYFVTIGGLRNGIGPIKWIGLIRMGVLDHSRAVDFTKIVIAVLAAAAVFWERQRIGERRPFSERWKRFVGVVLGLAAIASYFGGFDFGYPKFYHRWDQYHYYMGAKYFRELGYDGLYRCSLIAQDEIGTISYDDAEHIGAGRRQVDMSREVRSPDKKIRNLGRDNLLVPVTEFLEHPEDCKRWFSPARWEAYKADVAFFRIVSDRKTWDDMQQDHGYNPPPVWTVAGRALASAAPAGKVFDLPIIHHVNWLQCLAMLDVLYTAAMFVALWWAFGWRVFAVGAILWGTQSAASAYWTMGAFLRQDWLFWLVLSACLVKKRWFALAGASMVYAALLRVFPVLAVIGWLAVTGWHVYRHGTLSRAQRRMLAGGVAAAAILVPASLWVAGTDAYQKFYVHTLEVHDRTPLTNHMGLRVLVSQKLPFEIVIGEGDDRFAVGTGPQSGRMKYVRDGKTSDPFEAWKQMRNQRYDKLRLVAYGIVALTLLLFVRITKRLQSLWVAGCLAQIFIILMSQLTCYYYCFMILLAPATRVRRELEVPIFGFCALSQLTFFSFGNYDDKYWMLTLVSLALSYVALWLFLPREDRARLWAPLRRPAEAAAR
jgi:hypothetical protein